MENFTFELNDHCHNIPNIKRNIEIFSILRLSYKKAPNDLRLRIVGGRGFCSGAEKA